MHAPALIQYPVISASQLDLPWLTQCPVIPPDLLLHTLQPIMHGPQFLRLCLICLVLRHPLMQRLVLLVVLLKTLRLLQHGGVGCEGFSGEEIDSLSASDSLRVTVG